LEAFRGARHGSQATASCAWQDPISGCLLAFVSTGYPATSVKLLRLKRITDLLDEHERLVESLLELVFIFRTGRRHAVFLGVGHAFVVAA